ncbi:MAG: HAMP domain-containing histidine kinase [Lachnospiraceae bacterium]|nr:HAMP domain-containing histidine kinase [Lachnospiraceae bacterium]
MDIIKKIAVAASAMLFILTQLFSFYIIYSSHKEKLELVKQEGAKRIENERKNLDLRLNKLEIKNNFSDYIVVQCFRNEMPEDSALYRDGEELYNSSRYQFDLNISRTGRDEGWELNCISRKVNGTHLLMYYGIMEENENEYVFFRVKDISYLYEDSLRLVFKEFLISFLISGFAALLLLAMIRKITRPLEATNEAQRQLIGSMSHELKTPLTAIKGYSELLLNVKLTKEQAEKAINYIYTESGRMSRLSEKMMELTQLYESESSIVPEKVEIEEIFNEVEDNVKQMLSEKELKLIYEGNYQGLSKKLDKDLIISFLINLINNSMMASKAGDCIYLGADETALWVRDEGVGIPEKEIDKVRKAFYRVDKSRSRKSGNMGLGLALCEQIAKVHHAEMRIESKQGVGTKIALLYGTLTN